MPKCSYCGTEYDFPRGLTFVLPNGDILYFCCSKCRKNHKMGRRGDKRNWIRKPKKVKGNTETLKKENKLEADKKKDTNKK